MKLIPEYQKKLDNLREKMEKAQIFAEKVPVLKDVILEGMFSGEEAHQKYLSRYKKIPLAWGLLRTYYHPSKNTTLKSNWVKGDNYSGYLFHVYINTLTLYDSHEKHGLDEVVKKTPITFFDGWNSTFYCTDDQVEGLLEALNDWYVQALEKEKQYRVEKEKNELKKRLAELEVPE